MYYDPGFGFAAWVAKPEFRLAEMLGIMQVNAV